MPLLAVIVVVITLGTSVDWVTALLVGPGGFVLGALAGWCTHAWINLGGDHDER